MLHPLEPWHCHWATELHTPGSFDTDVPAEHENFVELLHTPFTAQDAFALLQDAVVPPLSPVQLQVADPPHEPATFEAEVPAEQAKLVLLLQDPLTGHDAFALLQLAFEPPFGLLQLQVADPPHDPATFDTEVPTEQEKLVELSHTPAMHAGFAVLQLALLHPFVPLQVHV